MRYHFKPHALLLAAVFPAVGCQTENELAGKSSEPEAFDEGDEWSAPVDTAEEELDTDDGEVVVPVVCPEKNFPAEPVAQDATCDGGPANPDWDLQVLWEVQVGSGSYNPPVVGQLTDDNGDGVVDSNDTPDVITLDTATVIRSHSGADGSLNWQQTMSNTVNTLAAIGDANADGFPDLLTDKNYSMTLLDGQTGGVIWTGPASGSKNKGSCGAVGMADLDGDGEPEAYLGNLIVSGMNGRTLGNGNAGSGLGVGNSYGHTVAIDLDDDGQMEVVAGNASYDAAGNIVEQNGGTDGTVAVADLDRDGLPEIISVSNYGVSVMTYRFDDVWDADLGGALPSTPVVADLDGDGYPEVVIPTTNKVFAFTSDGDELWTYEASGGSGRGGASAYDLDGNGTWEVIWSSPNSLQIIDGVSGEQLTEYRYTGSNTNCAGPVPIADLDGDDHAEIIVVDSSGKLRALQDTNGFTDAGGNWHQSDYSLTNIEDDAGMPVAPEPNWKGENNFRAGPSVTMVQSLYPVIRDVCIDQCSEETVWVWFSVANSGFYDMAGRVDLEFWGLGDAGMVFLASHSWNGTVEPGMMTESAFIELRNVPRPLHNVQVRMVGTSNEGIEDCQSSDDIYTWSSEVCL
jgi:hypothetical protein